MSRQSQSAFLTMHSCQCKVDQAILFLSSAALCVAVEDDSLAMEAWFHLAAAQARKPGRHDVACLCFFKAVQIAKRLHPRSHMVRIAV